MSDFEETLASADRPIEETGIKVVAIAKTAETPWP
jgi:hypothetical protein